MEVRQRWHVREEENPSVRTDEGRESELERMEKERTWHGRISHCESSHSLPTHMRHGPCAWEAGTNYGWSISYASCSRFSLRGCLVANGLK